VGLRASDPEGPIALGFGTISGFQTAD